MEEIENIDIDNVKIINNRSDFWNKQEEIENMDLDEFEYNLERETFKKQYNGIQEIHSVLMYFSIRRGYLSSFLFSFIFLIIFSFLGFFDIIFNFSFLTIVSMISIPIFAFCSFIFIILLSSLDESFPTRKCLNKKLKKQIRKNEQKILELFFIYEWYTYNQLSKKEG